MEVIEKAQKRIAKIKAELRKLEDFLSIYDALSEEGGEIPVDNSDSKPAPKRVRGGSSPAMIIQIARAAIIDKGSPMTRTQLVEELENRGLKIGGGDKSKNMGTIIWRSKKFDNIEGYGYWPKDAGSWEGDPLLGL